MTAIVKLVHGSESINLMDAGKYWPSVDFIPPATQTTPTLARGTVQSRYTGSSLVNQTANDSQLDFTIRCYGVTAGEANQRARKLQSFLSYAGDKVTPFQLHYRESADIASEPLWGDYGSNKRYTIIHANASLKESYSLAGVRAQVVEVVVSLLIAPYADGLKMRLASATGGILEDTIGTVDGRSRGLIIPEATTNKMTNPVFGHGTWDNGWTTAAGVSSSENTDNEFILLTYGQSSAKVRGIAAASNTFTQSIDAGNTNGHSLGCFIKLEDSGVVSSTQCDLWYGGAQTTTYTSMGNGWYWLTASFSGVASATATGIRVKNKQSVYTTGWMFEEIVYPTTPGHGDMMGWSWSGTAHASTSTRTAGRVRISTDYLNVAEGTIAAVIKTKISSADFGSELPTIFEEDTGELRFLYNGTITDWTFTDGTNTATSSDETFDVNETIVLHVTWGADGLFIYKNGSQIATNATYTPFTMGTYVYIGTSDSPGRHNNATMLDFRSYATAATAAEVLADYTNIAAIIADGERVGNIPWLWTNDGEDIIDAREDASGSNKFYCGGIPGSVPAKTNIRIDVDVDTGTIDNLFLARVTLPYKDIAFRSVEDSPQWMKDWSGSADANANGGEYDLVAANTSMGHQASYAVTDPKLSLGYTHIFARLKMSTAGTYNIAPSVSLGNIRMFPNDTKPLSLTTSWELYYVGAIAGQLPSFLDKSDFYIGYGIAGYAASAYNLHLDYFMAINGDVVRISKTQISHDVVLQGSESYEVHDTSGVYEQLPVVGDIVELNPQGNIMWIMSSGVNLISQHYTIEHIDITPRYALL